MIRGAELRRDPEVKSALKGERGGDAREGV